MYNSKIDHVLHSSLPLTNFGGCQIREGVAFSRNL